MNSINISAGALIEHMHEAMQEASKSLPQDVPIGAIVIDLNTGEIIGRGHNERELDNDPTCHAEIVALRDAAKTLGDWRLGGCAVIVTLEPCIMCAGALSQSRIGGVVFGAYDEQSGAAGSIYNFFADPRLPHNPPVIGGILGEENQKILSNFFASKR
jgi:tRNA(adenine34) deaminase